MIIPDESNEMKGCDKFTAFFFGLQPACKLKLILMTLEKIQSESLGNDENDSNLFCKKCSDKYAQVRYSNSSWCCIFEDEEMAEKKPPLVSGISEMMH